MFSVWNLRYSPTAWHFAQPGRVGIVGLVFPVRLRTALWALNIKTHWSRSRGVLAQINAAAGVSYFPGPWVNL